MRHLLLLGIATVGIVGAAIAQAPARTPAELIQNRQAGYRQIRDANKAINDQLQASEPSLATIRQNSAALVRLTPQVSGWFPAGTGPETGVRTRAKAEIWARPQEFRTAAVNLVVAARRLDAAARGNDVAAIRAAHGALGRTCSACHDQFRGPAT